MPQNKKYPTPVVKSERWDLKHGKRHEDVIRILSRGASLTASQLGERLNMKGGINYVLRKLIDDGIVEKRSREDINDNAPTYCLKKKPDEVKS